MNYSDYRFTLDIQIHQAQVSVPVTFGDTARRLCIGLTDGRKPYTIPDGCMAVFNARKPDGKTIKNYCTIERNTIIYEFTDQTTNVEGIVNCDITLYNTEDREITSPQFIIVVDKKVVRDTDVAVSQSQANILTTILRSEASRTESETNRISAEDDRINAENTRVSNEVERTSAEEARVEAETIRVEAETERVEAEAERDEAENIRSQAETERASAETARLEAETGRNENENTRVSNEHIRGINEEARVTAEEARADAEAARALAETERDRIVREGVPVVHIKGSNETQVMSQKTVTENLDAILKAFETEGGYNLLDPNNAESGYYENVNGVLTPNAGWGNHMRTVTPIPVVGGSKLYIASTKDSNENISVFALDKNGTVLDVANKKFSNAFSGLSFSVNANATAIHIYISGVANYGYSFNNICVSNTVISGYEEYGLVKTPTALKNNMLSQELKNKLAELSANLDDLEYVNKNNLVEDAVLKDSTKWNTFIATVEKTGLPANAISMTNSGSTAYIRQYLPISKFSNGTYYASIKWLEGTKGTLTITGLDASYTKTTLITVTSSSVEEDKTFKLDTSLYAQIEFMFKLGDITTIKVTEPILALVEGDEIPSFYNDPYQKIFDTLTEAEQLQSQVETLQSQVENVNPLYGKIISFNGDSICEARATNGGGYATIIGANNNMTVENRGVSGATVMYAEGTGKHCISRDIVNMRADADYIILEGGVNDLNSDRPLGTMSNGYNATLDDTTFYGAFENMLKQALIRFHGKKIGYIAVHKMTQYFDSDKTEDNAYHAAIKCCAKWGIPVLDLNKTVPPFGYLRNNADTVFIPNTYTEDTATAGVGDGWHPNEDGYKKYYVPKIEAWLKTL